MIAEFLYKNPKLLLLTIAVIVVAGLSSIYVTPRVEDPVLRKRVAVITTVFAGAEAGRIESLVTMPLEEQLAGIPEIKQVRSNTRTNISNIVIELADSVNDVDSIWSTVRNRMLDVAADLPEGCEEPDLYVFPLKAYASIVAVKSNDNAEPNLVLLRRLAKKLRSRLISIPGTEDLHSFGDPGEEYVVEISPLRLAALGQSPGAVAQQVSASLANQSAGRISSGHADLLLDIADPLTARDQLRDVSIRYERGETTTLSQIATVEKRLIQPAPYVSLIDDQPAIVLAALVSDEIRVDHWANDFDAAVTSFQNEHSADVTVEVLFSQREHVDQRMTTLLTNLAMGTGAVVFAVLLLMGWRSMLIVATALPLSALMVMTGMRLLSIPIHQMSATGLIIALGLLIDNAIVIVEEVRAKILAGMATQTAIVKSVRHLMMPLFASTLTTALAFLPIATLPGPSGEFVGTIAISVILAICSSFALSMTIIPAMHNLLKIDPAKRGFISSGLSNRRVEWVYEASLRWLFRFPILGVLLGLVLPVLGFVAATQLPLQFFPPSDRQQIQIEIEGSADQTVPGVHNTYKQVREIVGRNKNVHRQHWFLGGSAPTFYYNVVPRRRGTPFYGQAFVDLKTGGDIGKVVQELQQALDAEILHSRITVRQLEQGPPFDAPIELRLSGPDLTRLRELGMQLRLLLSETPHVIHTRSDLDESIPKLALALDRNLAKEVGMTRSDIARQLYVTLEGAPAGTIFEGDEDLPIRIVTPLGDASKMNLLAAMRLQPPPGNRPPQPIGNGPPPPPVQPTVASLGGFELESEFGGIVRINGRRVNEVKAYIRAGALPWVVSTDFRQRLTDSDFVLPDGYKLEHGGETEKRTQAVSALIANSFVLFAIMLLILVALFRSVRCAFIIAVVGGLSAGLGPLGLYVMEFPFGFMAIVGAMGLIGVAINDSIVVLAAIRDSDQAKNGDPNEMSKVVAGCTRHVITTTLTTIVGFTPLIIGGGGFWPPLAITIAGGVGGSTLLALYFAPSLYLLLHLKRTIPAPSGH